jgi:hypothetical protein
MKQEFYTLFFHPGMCVRAHMIPEGTSFRKHTQCDSKLLSGFPRQVIFKPEVIK